MRSQRLRSSCILVLAAFTVACSADSTGPGNAPYDQASATKGGISYDNFWNISSGFAQTDPRIATFNAKSDFYRCKQCHGWDRLGRAGAYINRKASATRPNISAVNLVEVTRAKSAQQLFDAIKVGTGVARRAPTADLSTYNPTTNPTVGDQMPDYGAILSDAQIWDLVRFLKGDAYDLRQLFDMTISGSYSTGSASFANIGKDGNAALGDSIYVADCKFCHGFDGRALALEGQTLGAFLRGKPHETQHKVRYGQLGSNMGPTPLTLIQMKHLYRHIADTTRFPR